MSKGLDYPDSPGWYLYKDGGIIKFLHIVDIKTDSEFLTFSIADGDSVTGIWDFGHQIKGKFFKLDIEKLTGGRAIGNQHSQSQTL